LSKLLDQETAKGPLRSSSQAATYYYQCNYSMVEAISLRALPNDATSKLGRHICILHTHSFKCRRSSRKVV